MISAWSLAPLSNPCMGNLTLQVNVPQSGTVNLVIHDVAGRIIVGHSQTLTGDRKLQ